MNTTKLSAKGKVVLPKAVRDAYGWKPGDEFVVESTPVGVLLRPRSGKRTGRVADLAGILKKPGQRRVSLDEMEVAGWKAVNVKKFLQLSDEKAKLVELGLDVADAVKASRHKRGPSQIGLAKRMGAKQ